MSINANSIAPAVGAGIRNTSFQVSANVLAQKIIIVGTFDPLKTAIVADTLMQVFSPEQVGDLTGFGFPLHRMAERVFEGSDGDVEVWMIPQDEAGTPASATGTITYVATSASAGTIKLYIAGLSVDVVIASGDDDEALATKTAAAINAIKELPVTAVAALAVVTITAKDQSTFGNETTIKLNIKEDDALPTGITSATIVAMSGGLGTPDIQTALDALGTDDAANEKFFTRMVHSYLQDSGTFDAISAYVGEGNDFVGLYKKIVARPFTALTGDIVAETAGLTALIAISDVRLEDRANGIIAVPGSASHPSEIAAFAVGIMAKKNNILAQAGYNGESMGSIDPGALADRWTNAYTLGRDLAAKSGISPTDVVNGVVKLQVIVTFYRPASVAVNSNAYRSMRNISILQNIMNAVKANFSRDTWKDFSIVADVSKVTDVNSRLEAKDIETVKDDLVSLATLFESKAWIFSAAFTIEKLKQSDSVVIRGAGNGFDSILRTQLSGEGVILDTVTEVDTAISV